MGVAMFALADVFANLLQLPVELVREAGIILLPFAAFVGFVASRREPARIAVWTIIALNVGLGCRQHRAVVHRLGRAQRARLCLRDRAGCGGARARGFRVHGPEEIHGRRGVTIEMSDTWRGHDTHRGAS